MKSGTTGLLNDLFLLQYLRKRKLKTATEN